MLEARPTASSEVFLARQAVLDRQQRCIGYELLCRSSKQNVNLFGAGDAATMQTMDIALHLGGMLELTDGKKAFINFTEGLLIDDVAHVLPPSRTVVEVLETVVPTPQVVEACRRLKSVGYELALDDYIKAGSAGGLEGLADIVKVDFLNTSAAERETIAKRFLPQKVKLLAEKVETQEDFNQGLALGYHLFQGYFFCKPQVMQRKQPSMEKSRYLRFLQEVSKPELDFTELEETIRQEPGLAVRLLSYLNSASIGLRERVTSIRHALALLGEINLRKWAAVFAMSALAEEKPPELVRTSLVRARFGEVLAEVSKVAQPFDAFLVGLLSSLDAMLDRSMPELLRQIVVSHEVKAALMASSGKLGGLRRLVSAYEVADWPGVQRHTDTLGLSTAHVTEAYRQGVSWADAVAA